MIQIVTRGLKYRGKSNPITKEEIEQLKKKSEHVRWRDENRNEHYGIIARTIEGKKGLIDAGYFVFDLRDFEEWVAG